MKKTIYLVLLAILLCGCFLLTFSSCNSKKYEYVSYVTITTAGETKTFRSGFYLKEQTSQYITLEEYNNAPENEKIGYSNFGGEIELPPKKEWGCVSYYKPYDKIKTFYSIETPSFSLYDTKFYKKTTYKGIIYYYVQVKVINDTTISIKDVSGTTTYTVTSYKMVPLKKTK